MASKAPPTRFPSTPSAPLSHPASPIFFPQAEAMKMIIQLKAAEGGKVTHEKQPGSIINQGDLLASLELKDPSKV